MKKMLRKFLSVISVLVLFTVIDFGGSNTASAAFWCNYGGRCQDVYLPYGYTYAGSPNLYLYKGETAIVDFKQKLIVNTM